MARLSIALLGSPLIERNGAPIQVDTRKAIALLVYLAVTRRPHNRDVLAALLWPEYDQASARSSLRRTLSALKKGLGDDVNWLEIEGERLALRCDDPGVEIDVQDFHLALAESVHHGHARADVCPACLDPLIRAVEIYRGEFLAGFSLRESATFEDWQLYEAGLVAREFSGALERLVKALSLRHEFDKAITYARRWLTLDPLHEPAQRELMRLYAWAGERGAALRQYRECARTLEKELGVPPLAETTRLIEAIREDHLPAPPPRAEAWIETAPAPRVSVARSAQLAETPAPSIRQARGTPALVGRASEWATLIEAYEGAPSSGSLVVLSGEAGIGKTALSEHLLTHAVERGAPVLAARCYEGESGLAYAPIASAIRTALASSAGWLHSIPDHWVAEAASLVPELAVVRADLRPTAPAADPGAQGRFLEALSQVLVAATAAMPVTSATDAILAPSPRPILFIDDVHWADEATLDLLAFLVRRVSGRALFVLITWRNEAVPAGHRLRHMVTDARRAGFASAIELHRLNQSEVGELVQQTLDVSDTTRAALTETLYRETEGLPFFVAEYLRAVESGAMHAESVPRSLPGGVRELLQSRIATVDETGKQLLATAAIIGRSFEFDTLREVSGRSEDEAVVALEQLITLGLVREVPAARLPTFDFTHERLREVVEEQLGLLRRRLLHRRIAEVLGRRIRGQVGDPGPLAGQIAVHFQAAGQEREAARYYRLAGEHARGIFANAEALSHFCTALALGETPRDALHGAIGDLHTLAGDYGAAQASFELAAAECEIEDLPEIELKLGDLYGRRGEWELAESHFQAALSAFGPAAPAHQLARVYADQSLIAHRRGQAEHADELAQRARELAELAADRRVLAQAHNILGILARDRGAADIARQHLENSLTLAEALDDAAARASALNNLALACASEGDINQAVAKFGEALTLCAARGDRHREAALHNNLADVLHAAGRHSEAMGHLKRAVALFGEVGAEPGALPPPEIWKLTAW